TATVAAIDLVGATPVIVDVDPITQTMDVGCLETVLTDGYVGLKAVIPVHLFGNPAPIVEITDLARRHGLFVIEDCAQAHGATANGRRVGSFGDFGAFSFYPTKNLGAFGDGGFLTTNNRTFAGRASQMKQYGWRERFVSELAGMNTRLDELQASVLRVKLHSLDEANARRRELAREYDKRLSDTSLVLPFARQV